MNILITGSRGQLGTALQQQLQRSDHCIAAHDIDTVDLRDPNQIRKAFSEFRPDVVINAAAYTAVDKAEADQETADLINHVVVTWLLDECERHNARLIQVSTDFVFDGKQGVPYLPSDSCAPLNVYGETKLKAEQAIMASHARNSLIIRTAWLYSPHGNNFVKSMLRLMSEKNELGIVADQIGTPTSAASLAGLIKAALEKPSLAGIYHWTDSGVASWYDFAVAIKEEALSIGLLTRDVPVRPIPAREYPSPAQRPAFSVLDKQATYRDFDVSPVHWREQLRQVLSTTRNSRA